MINASLDFRQSAHGTTWNEVVSNPQFQEAAKAAMYEFGKDISREPTTAGLKLEGAYAFLSKLTSLCDIPKPQPRVDTLNLTHK